MKYALAGFLCLAGVLLIETVAGAQEARLGPVVTPGPVPCGTSACPGAAGLHWTQECFPRCGCPDDYCPHPYPRQCWPPYATYYRCVPAGNCAATADPNRAGDRLTWWFLPTPRALREAIWCQP
jgi:hypothetical protein